MIETASASPPLRPSPDAAREHPVAWACYVAEKYRAARHVRFLGGILRQVEQGRLNRVVISCPPRHGKSWLVSRFFAAWWLCRHPEHKVMLVTMQERFSRKWGRAARDDFAAFAPELFGLMAYARASTAEWEVFRDGARTEGSMSAIGAGGTITGKGADLMLVDDLIRSSAEAQNPTLRESQWDWFQSAVETRLEPPGRVVIIMTRWHHDDVIGRLKKAQEKGELGDPYTFVNLPAIAEEGDPMGRKLGEALWPERISAEWLEKKRKNVGPQVWESLYQGRPTPLAGNVFKRAWFRYYDKDESGRKVLIKGRAPIEIAKLYRFATVDLAASMKRRADYTVMAIWGFARGPHALILLDLVRARLSGTEIVALLSSRQKAHALEVVYVERAGKWLEEKIGSVVKVAADQGVPVAEIAPEKDKLERARAAEGPFAAGQVFFPKASFLPDFEEELTTFPEAEHDDQVDAVSYAVGIYRELVAATAPTRPSDERADVGEDGWWSGQNPDEPWDTFA